MSVLKLTFYMAILVAVAEINPLTAKCSKANKGTFCKLFPYSGEGPFYLPYHLVRKDVREDTLGIPITLNIQVVDIDTCHPITEVAVDIWNADYGGDYSSFRGIKKNDTVDGVVITDRLNKSDHSTYLRGIQYTDQEGRVSFITNYPGRYEGRSNHIHFDVHVNNKKHTAQVYFMESINSAIAKAPPYNRNKNPRTLNTEDRWYAGYEGANTTLDVVGDICTGFSASLYMGYDSKG